MSTGRTRQSKPLSSDGCFRRRDAAATVATLAATKYFAAERAARVDDSKVPTAARATNEAVPLDT